MALGDLRVERSRRRFAERCRRDEKPKSDLLLAPAQGFLGPLEVAPPPRPAIPLVETSEERPRGVVPWRPRDEFSRDLLGVALVAAPDGVVEGGGGVDLNVTAL
jgi:hypothetical protein